MAAILQADGGHGIRNGRVVFAEDERCALAYRIPYVIVSVPRLSPERDESISGSDKAAVRKKFCGIAPSGPLISHLSTRRDDIQLIAMSLLFPKPRKHCLLSV